MKHCLRLSSLLLLLFVASCANPYKHLKQVENASQHASALRFKPVFEKELYRCVVDGKFLFKKFHLSGVLFFKKMPDESTRVVFQNEMGFAFFDFEWSKNDSFEVKQVIPQLDKPAVIKILQKDFELLLMKKLNTPTEQTFLKTIAEENTKDAVFYHKIALDKGYVYYITVDDQRLKRIENAGGKSRVTTMTIGPKPKDTALPEKLFIKHHKAHFTIDLTKIDNNASE